MHVVGSIFYDFWDRPFGDNLIFTADTFNKQGFAGSEIALVLNDFLLMIGQLFHHFWTILASFFNVLLTYILASIFISMLISLGPSKFPNSCSSAPHQTKNRTGSSK